MAIEKKVYTLPSGEKVYCEVGYPHEFTRRDQVRMLRQGFSMGLCAGLFLANLITVLSDLWLK